ncbi:hypothetical protein ACHAPT_010285 [Fusarium lateritium]
MSSTRTASLFPPIPPTPLADAISTPSLPLSDTFKISVGPEIQCSRIMVIGRAGAGKSTLCSRVFGVDYPKASSHNVDVWEEVRFPQNNNSIIFHDYRGFETGATDLVQDVDKFIQERREMLKLEDQIHCIWYCISCVDDRPFRSPDKRFFQKFNNSQIPLVVIFTQFDRLVKAKAGDMIEQYQHDDNITKQHLLGLGYTRAEKHYTDNLYEPLREILGRGGSVIIKRTELPPDPRLPATLDNILDGTRELLTSDALKTVLTAAQRVDADSKLEESLVQGAKAFWQIQGWSSVPLLPGAPFIAQKMAFKKVYRLIYQLWNFPPTFANAFEVNSTRHKFYEACFHASAAVRVGTDIIRALDITGPVTASLSMKTLLMLIIGVSLICESLFWKFTQNGVFLTQDDILKSIEEFSVSKQRAHAMDVVSKESGFLSHAFDKENCLALLRKAIKRGGSDGYRDTPKLEKGNIVGSA